MLVKDFGNIFDNNEQADLDTRPGFISYSIEPEVIISMTKELLELK